MRNIISAKLLSCFLFLATSSLMLCPLVVINAQPRSAAVNLEGTEWATPPTSYAVGSTMGTVQCFYTFEGNGKAVYGCLAIQSPGTMVGTNLNDPVFIPGTEDPYRPKLVTTPGGSAFPKTVGKYTQSGNSIRVEFSDAVMNITVKDNTLIGETVFTDTSKSKEKWNMRRISKDKPDSATDDKKNNPGKPLSVSQQLAIQQQADMKESENKSQFSLSEFQNSYFKPVPLTRNVISGTNPEGSLNYLNYFFVADSGKINIAFSLNASQESYASQVIVEVQDRENNVIAKKFVTTNVGKSAQEIISVDIAQKQALLLRVILSGGGSYQVQLNGSSVSN